MNDVDKLREHADWIDDFLSRGPGRIPTVRLVRVAEDLRRIANSIDGRDGLHWWDDTGSEWCPISWRDEGDESRVVRFYPVETLHTHAASPIGDEL